MTTNKQVATAFRNSVEGKSQTESFYTEIINGVVIAFSYGRHFPICVKFTDGVFFNSEGYSNTTGRHKSLIRGELSDELTDSDYKTTKELISIVDKVKYNAVKSKAELTLLKI